MPQGNGYRLHFKTCPGYCATKVSACKPVLGARVLPEVSLTQSNAVMKLDLDLRFWLSFSNKLDLALQMWVLMLILLS